MRPRPRKQRVATIFATTDEGDLRPRPDSWRPGPEIGEKQPFLRRPWRATCGPGPTVGVRGQKLASRNNCLSFLRRPWRAACGPGPTVGIRRQASRNHFCDDRGGRHTAPARRSDSGAGHRRAPTIFATTPNCANNNISIQRCIPSFQCHTVLVSAWYHCVAFQRCIVANTASWHADADCFLPTRNRCCRKF